MSSVTAESIERALALETSGRVGSLAAFRSEDNSIQVVARQVLPSDKRFAQSLLPAIAELLRTCGWQARQLQLICTTTGPGSFTGLRIGVTAAKTIAYATGAKLVGVHTLSALAGALKDDAARAWAIGDAQRQELFAAEFPAGWRDDPDFAPRTVVLSEEAWLAELRGGDMVIGSPLDKLSDGLPVGVTIADPQLWLPSAAIVAELGAAALRRGQTIAPMQLVPHYFRASAAEEKAAVRTKP